MKVDAFDGTLACGQDDLQTVLRFFEDYRMLPEYLEKSILEIIVESISEKPPSMATMDEYLSKLPAYFIQRSVKSINTMFLDSKKIESYEQNCLSYLLYYLPANVFKVWKPLLDLLLRNALKPTVMVLDIGTGPGSVPIGIIEFYKALAESFPEIRFQLSFTLLDAEGQFLYIAQRLIRKVLRSLPSNLTIEIAQVICKTVNDDKISCLGEYDLITMSNFIAPNERDNNKKAISIISNLIDNMNRSGSLIIINPGEKKSCIALKNLRNELINNKLLNQFSPCIGIWENKEFYHCACFNMTRCYWRIPKIHDFLLQRGVNKNRRIDVPFNYVIFRRDNLKKYPVIRNLQSYTKLVDLKNKIGEVVNVKAILRTVKEYKDKFSMALCDGSWDCSEEIWINLTKSQLAEFGIQTTFISGERITLKKVSVKKNANIIIEANPNSRIEVEY